MAGRFEGKQALVLGVANRRSIAWAIAHRLADEAQYLDTDGKLHPEILAARREPGPEVVGADREENADRAFDRRAVARVPESDDGRHRDQDERREQGRDRDTPSPSHDEFTHVAALVKA